MKKEKKKVLPIVFVICFIACIFLVKTSNRIKSALKSYAYVLKIEDQQIITQDMETDDIFAIHKDDIKTSVFNDLEAFDVIEISHGNIVHETFPAEYNKVFSVEKLGNAISSTSTIVDSEGNIIQPISSTGYYYVSILESEKVEITKENFNDFFEITEEVGWESGNVPCVLYTLSLKDEYQLALSNNNKLSYTYTYNEEKRYYSIDQSATITWLESEVLEKHQDENSCERLYESVSFDAYDSLLNKDDIHIGDHPFIYAKTNIEIIECSGSMYIKHISSN